MSVDIRIERVHGVREALRFRRSPLAYIGDVAARGTDIRYIDNGKQKLFLVNNTELIRDVLVTNDWNFVKGPGLRASQRVLGNGLLTSEGELHRRQRRLIQPGFNHDRLARYALNMVESTAQLSDSWLDGQQYAINEEMMRLTLRIVTQCLFSTNIGEDANEVGNALTEVLRVSNRVLSPLARRFSFIQRLMLRRGAKSRDRLNAVLQRIIREHRNSVGQFDDLLSMLVDAKDEGNTYMSDVLLRDEAMTLFLAGHETTANALTWTWYLLAQHGNVEEKMVAEIHRHLGRRSPTVDDLRGLPYTNRVFCEALRLYPPAWIIARQAVTDYRLGTVEVPAGAILFMSPFGTHRDPRFWKDPEAFSPERWSDESTVSIRPRFAFFPFGAGSRVCIGEHFAMMEGVLVLATLAQRWRLYLLPGQNVEPWPRITLRPRDSIRFRIHRRDVNADKEIDLQTIPAASEQKTA